MAVLKELSRAKRGQAMKSPGDTLVSGGLSSIIAFEQMHLMAKYLVDTLNSNAGEYDDYVRNKREFRERMKSAE